MSQIRYCVYFSCAWKTHTTLCNTSNINSCKNVITSVKMWLQVTSWNAWTNVGPQNLGTRGGHLICLKPGIHLRQRQTMAQRSSFSWANVDGPTNWVTCLRGDRNPNHWLLVDQSEGGPRNSSPHAHYGCNIPRLTETEKHRLIWDAIYRRCCAMHRLASASSVFRALGCVC